MALVGTRFWRLICIALHYIFSKDGPNDGIYRQRQAFLRNAPNRGCAWNTCRYGVFLEHNAEKIWSRLLPLILGCAACFVGFILAGGFSSRVATLVSSEVLLSGTNCGSSETTVTSALLVTPMARWSLRLQ